MKTFISSFAHSQDHPQEDIAMDDAGKVILVELQQVAESLGLPFHMERYSTILNQLCSEYDDECVDLGMHLQLVHYIIPYIYNIAYAITIERTPPNYLSPLLTFLQVRFCGLACFLVSTRRFLHKIRRT